MLTNSGGFPRLGDAGWSYTIFWKLLFLFYINKAGKKIWLCQRHMLAYESSLPKQDKKTAQHPASNSTSSQHNCTPPSHQCPADLCIHGLTLEPQDSGQKRTIKKVGQHMSTQHTFLVYTRNLDFDVKFVKC